MTSWAAVLYARTQHDDTWWRAAPADRAQDQWLKRQVHTVVAGGRGLDRHPRFLLAHDGTSRFFGVACVSARLSATMNATGGRPTYCFAGWVSERDAGPANVPPWDAVTEHWPRWAAAVYQRWVAPDWSRPRSARVALPHHTEYAPDSHWWPDAIPWTGDGGTDQQELPPLRHGPHGTDAWPMSDARLLWAAAAVSAELVTAVAGVARADRRLLRGITHAAVLDLTERQLMPGAADE